MAPFCLRGRSGEGSSRPAGCGSVHGADSSQLEGLPPCKHANAGGEVFPKQTQPQEGGVGWSRTPTRPGIRTPGSGPSLPLTRCVTWVDSALSGPLTSVWDRTGVSSPKHADEGSVQTWSQLQPQLWATFYVALGLSFPQRAIRGGPPSNPKSSWTPLRLCWLGNGDPLLPFSSCSPVHTSPRSTLHTRDITWSSCCWEGIE